MLRLFRRRAEPLPLRLYTRPGCCLCDQVKQQLQEWMEAGRVRLEEVDVSGDAELERLHGAALPVLEHGGRVLAKGRFTVAEAMARLARRRGAEAQR